MSVPPFYDLPPPQEQCQPAEDCRDFLRTGRCKYGASCKYRHPPNVQSGGGFALPSDPSEPLNPLRPNEPNCMYFLKHGTCKFGQSCKFHHPPEARSGNRRRSDFDGTQVLPQRPDEPDCIYFLKNGRCKYGATCRYHHPFGFHRRRAEESRRQQLIQAQDYAAQIGLPPDPASIRLQSFQPVSVIMGPDAVMPYGQPVGSTMPLTDHGSSASSIASSYDTAPVAGMEHFADHSLSSRRNGSGNSLTAYLDTSSSGRSARRITPSTSDNNIARQRTRAASFGSETSYNQEYQGRMSRSGSVGSWRNDRPPLDRMTYRGGGVEVSLENRGTRRNGNGHRDEGFTMMTSALLTMMDHPTPEEASTESGLSDSRLPQEEPPTLMLNGLSLQEGNSGADLPPRQEQVHFPPRQEQVHYPPGLRSFQQDQALQVNGLSWQDDLYQQGPSHPRADTSGGQYFP